MERKIIVQALKRSFSTQSASQFDHPFRALDRFTDQQVWFGAAEWTKPEPPQGLVVSAKRLPLNAKI
ncbi:MAG: hypothetical protein GKR99_17900 [Rhodobacteraceae bacterium]|nr:hypothetical protein [Paracoccaceae bacterium]